MALHHVRDNSYSSPILQDFSPCMEDVHASSCEIHSKRIFTVYRGLFSNTGCSSARLGAAVITVIAFKVRTLNRYMETISIMVEALPPDRNRIM